MIIYDYAKFLLSRVERWFQKRRLQFTLQHSDWLFTPSIEKTARSGNLQALLDLHSELNAETESEREALNAMISVDLYNQGKKLHIYLDDIEAPQDEPYHWVTGSYGHLFLHERTRRTLKKLISERKKQKRSETWERVLKIGTFAAALVAALASLLSALGIKLHR